jgi:hypothetical protein
MPLALLGNFSRLRSAEMAKTIPIVEDSMVVADQTDGPFIHIDTPAWFTWLEAPTTTCFSYALFNRTQGYIDGFMTVRKERRQRGAAYWTVYRRLGQRLYKVYVGPSAALTQARLEQIAAQLRPRDGPPTNPHFFVAHPVVSSIHNRGHTAKQQWVRLSVRQYAQI